jgi:RimJ/RimL family protein N-acetyltransferase
VTAARVRLAPIRRKDGPTLFRWINDRDTVILSAGFKPVHATQHSAWLASLADRKDAVIFAIRLVRGDRLIGYCQLLSIDRVHRSAELQIRIGEKKARGRGYGVEAVRQLVEFAFRDLGLHRVWLQVFATNARALKAYEKAGFTREGRMREGVFVDGRFVDVVAMGILADE